MHESFHNSQRTTTYFVERNLLRTPASPDAEISRGPIVIGNDVWIGAGSKILSGVRVGDGAIIGAGTIVTRDVPAFSVVGGNPGRVLRARFSPEVTDRLQSSEWWNWSEERLREEAGFLVEIHARGR
ncbi:CatB-related O-acetyltransferase [Alcanivorax sp. 1008]|nr:CatB-related O-acetyltransferase [Alcanivorax sp. 1008]